jgi:prepilin signal peptidase PulO-like enzyme (type II secretory pathway)
MFIGINQIIYLAVLPPLTYVFAAALAGILLALSWVDLREFRLPDPLNFLLIGIGLVWSALAGKLPAALIGAAAGYLAFVGIAWTFRRLRGIDGLGRGDAKLLAGGGAWCGWMGLPLIVLIASLLGIVMALSAPLWQKPASVKAEIKSGLKNGKKSGIITGTNNTQAHGEQTETEEGPPAGWIPFGPCLAVGIFAVWTAGQIVPTAF